MWSKRPHQEDRSQISDCQNFKASPVATDLISEDNEGDLYTLKMRYVIEAVTSRGQRSDIGLSEFQGVACSDILKVVNNVCGMDTPVE